MKKLQRIPWKDVKQWLKAKGKSITIDDNFYLRLFALGLAVLLWFAAVSGERFSPFEQEVVVPIRAVNVPDDLAVMSDLGEATIMLRGLSLLLANLERDVEAVVNLAEVTEGTRTLRVQVNSPTGTSAAAVNPAVLNVTTERWLEQEFTVSVALVGAPAGYEPGQYTTQPAKALVRAPRSAMQRIIRLAAYVEVRDGVEERQYPLRVLDSNWQDVTPAVIMPAMVELRQVVP